MISNDHLFILATRAIKRGYEYPFYGAIAQGGRK